MWKAHAKHFAYALLILANTVVVASLVISICRWRKWSTDSHKELWFELPLFSLLSVCQSFLTSHS